MIKAIATDLDGTLFYPKRRIKGVCSSNIKFLKEFSKNGGEIVLISGRSIGCVNKLEKLLNSKVTFIGCNGAFVYKNNEYYNKKPLNKDALLDLFSKSYNNYSIFNTLLFDNHETMCNLPNEKFNNILGFMKFINLFRGFYRDPMTFDKKSFFDFFNSATIYKFSYMFGFDKDSSQTAYEATIAFKHNYSKYFDVAWSNNVIEITNIGVNKGNGLKEYCDNFNIKKEEILVVGDSGNDVSMFNYFPHSFIMSHSDKKLFKHANHVINRVSDLQKYLNDESLLKDDKILNSDN